MNKIRLISKKAYAQIVVKGQKGQQLCEREIHSINSGEIPGLLGMEVRGKGSAFELIYNVTGLIPLKQYLKAPLYRAGFAGLLGSVLETVKVMNDDFFSGESLLLDPEMSMVNPFTQSLHFVYIPIQDHSCQTPLREFLQSLVQLSSFAPDEDSSYVRDYILILNSGINFSVFELEEYWKRLTGGESRTPSAENVPAPEPERPAVYDPFAAASPREPEFCQAQSLESSQTHGGFSSAGTVLIGAETETEPRYPYLIRQRSNEKIVLHKYPFRIGQSQITCDYVVTDNPAVSRNHAQFFEENGQYFVVDLGSTNKTYVDGCQLQPEQRKSLTTGTKLQLANETFIFYVDNL